MGGGVPVSRVAWGTSSRVHAAASRVAWKYPFCLAVMLAPLLLFVAVAAVFRDGV